MAALRVLAVLVGLVLLAACEPGGGGEDEPVGDATPTPAEPGSDEVAVDDRAPTTAPTPSPTPAPTPAVVEGERLAWVAVEDADRLALVDLDAGEVVREETAPGGPHNLVVADDGTVAAALYASTELLVVDGDERTLVELGGTPHDVKATGEGFVVANEVAERLDLVTRDGEHTARIDLVAQPHDTAVHPDGDTAWVTMNGTDRLARVDLDAAEVVTYLPTGRSPHNVLFAPDGETAWLTDWGGPVHAFTADGERLESFPVGEETHHLAFTPDGSQVWATDHRTRKAYVFDVEARELVGEVTVPGMPHHVNITADGELAAIADHTNGELVVYDVASREQLRTVDVGPGPHGVWVVP